MVKLRSQVRDTPCGCLISRIRTDSINVGINTSAYQGTFLYLGGRTETMGLDRIAVQALPKLSQSNRAYC